MQMYDVLHDTAFMNAMNKLTNYYDVPNKIDAYSRRTRQNNPRVIAQSLDEEITMRELDPKYESMINDLWYRLDRQFVPESDKFVLDDSLLSHDFSALGSIMGCYWSHPGMFPINNKSLTRAKPMTEKEERTMRSIARRFFSGYSSSAASIKRDSSAGLAFHSPNLSLKQAAISNFFKHVDDIRDCATSSDMNGLISLGVTNAFMLGERLQPDSCEYTFQGKVPKVRPKKRFVNYGDEVIEPERMMQGYESSRYRARLRIVYGGNATTNLPFAILANPILHYALNIDSDVSRTVHHTTNWEDKIKDFPYPVGMDFSQFDMTISDDIIRIIFEEFDKALPEQFAFSRFLVPNAPVVAPWPVIVSKEKASEIQPSLWANRNPLTYKADDHRYSSGNQSGQFLVATVAKLAALFQTCSILEKMGLVVDPDKDFWRNDKFVVLNSGDDTLVSFREKVDAQHFEAIISAPKDDNDLWFEISVEKPITFLGRVLADVNGERLFLPDLTSYVVRFLRPEHHYYQKMFPRYGYNERKVYYSQHPRFAELDKLVNETVYDHYGQTLDDIVGEGEDIDSSLVANYNNLVFLETQGDAIFYKVDREDVDPDVFDSVFLTYPAEYVDSLFGVPAGYVSDKPSYRNAV